MKLELWESPYNEEKMDIEELIDLVTEGFYQCEGFCPSKSQYGCDRCECVRNTFPTPEHYTMYLKLREGYLSMVDVAITARHTKENLNDKT